MEINSLKINSLETKVDTLGQDLGSINGELNSQKIYEDTNEEYGIRCRAYCTGSVVTIRLYATSLKKNISIGTPNISFGNVGGSNAPLEDLTFMVSSAYGENFNVRIDTSGNIYVSYVYHNIPTTSQIIYMTSYVCVRG